MQTKESIKVYIDYKNGKTSCICLGSNKRCGKSCSLEVVERDKFRDWEDCFKVNRYGKSKGGD